MSLVLPPLLICGPQYSGKDTLADLIQQVLPDTNRAAFADKLKNEYCYSVGITRATLEKYKHQHRQNLQDYGAKMKQLHGETVWAEAVAKQGLHNLIVTDCRFICEHLYFVEKGLRPLTVRVEALTHHRQERAARKGHELVGINHPSETECAKINVAYRAENYGTIEAFKREALRVAAMWIMRGDINDNVDNRA